MGKVGLDHFFMCLKFKDLLVKYEPNKYAIIKNQVGTNPYSGNSVRDILLVAHSSTFYYS